MQSIQDYLKYFNAHLELKELFEEAKPESIISGFIYGSVPRGEIIPKVSDLDILLIADPKKLSESEMRLLNEINAKLVRKFRLHAVFRIHLKKELKQKEFARDFGPISLLNYLKDSWHLFGKEQDSLLWKAFRSKIKLVPQNLLRFALEYRYELLSLLSTHKWQSSTQNFGKSYKIADLAIDIAKVFAYSKAYDFTKDVQAVSYAHEATKAKIFAKCFELKAGKATLAAQEKFQSIKELLSVLNSIERSAVKNASKLIEEYRKLKFRKRTDAGLLLENAKNSKLLLLEHSCEENYWNIPKGGVRRNETLLDAALRELAEETGITDAKVDTSKSVQITHSYFKKPKLLIKTTTHIFKAETEQSTVKLSKEHKRYAWIPKSKLASYFKYQTQCLMLELNKR